MTKARLNKDHIAVLAAQGMSASEIATSAGYDHTKGTIMRFCRNHSIPLTRWNNGNAKPDKDIVSRLALKGMTAKQIATNFPGHTKNSIIGFCSRNNIELKKQRNSFKGKRSVAPKPPQLPRPKLHAVPKTEHTSEQQPASRYANRELSNQQCQWPDDCRDLRVLGRPYCPSHCDIAFKRMSA